MTIYVLTDGDYSDYHIVGIFSTEENAKNFIKASESTGTIEEHEIDELIKDSRLEFCVRINDTRTYGHWSSSHDNRTVINKVERNIWNKKDNEYIVHVMAENLDYAIKIASDLVAQYKALNND